MSSIIKVDTIQNQSGANIISESANTITVGASGDTVTIPSGATLGGAGTFDLSSGSVTLNADMKNTPAFMARQGSVQSIANTTQTTVIYDVVTFDTNSCFSTSTYRFTPNVAGKYLIGMSVRYDNVNSARCIGYIYKNTSIYTLDELWSDSGGGPDLSPQCVTIVEMNGSTDYVEAKTYHDKGFAVNTNPLESAISFYGYRLTGV